MEAHKYPRKKKRCKHFLLEVRNMDVCNLKIWFDRVYKTYRILSQLNYFPENIWEYIYHCEGQVNLANENQNIWLFHETEKLGFQLLVPAEFAGQVDFEHLGSCRDGDSTTFHLFVLSSFSSFFLQFFSFFLFCIFLIW